MTTSTTDPRGKVLRTFFTSTRTVKEGEEEEDPVRDIGPVTNESV